MAADSDRSVGRAKGLAGVMVEIIGSPASGLYLVEAAGELIAENARYNMWAYERKPRSTAPDLWNMTAILKRCVEDCSSAWEGHAKSADKSASLEELMGVLRHATERLRTVRVNDAIDFDDPDMPDEVRHL